MKDLRGEEGNELQPNTARRSLAETSVIPLVALLCNKDTMPLTPPCFLRFLVF